MSFMLTGADLGIVSSRKVDTHHFNVEDSAAKHRCSGARSWTCSNDLRLPGLISYVLSVCAWRTLTPYSKLFTMTHRGASVMTRVEAYCRLARFAKDPPFRFPEHTTTQHGIRYLAT